MDSQNTQILELLHEVIDRQAAIESLLQSLTSKKRKPEYLNLDEAAAMAGLTKGAVQHRLRREKEKPDGFPIRNIHGGVHRGDWKAYLDHLSSKNQGRGEIVRHALDSIHIGVEHYEEA